MLHSEVELGTEMEYGMVSIGTFWITKGLHCPCEVSLCACEVWRLNAQ
jgi:hypothetical protein